MGALFHQYRFGLFGMAMMALLLASSFVIVGEDKQVVIERMGVPDRVINRFSSDNADGAGITWKLPLIEQALWYPRGFLGFSHQSAMAAGRYRCDISDHRSGQAGRIARHHRQA
jgi:hypothetical protein